ncbi:MAG: DNA translocase FtsK, partial [Gemmatimonadetes bacterium]|nr:DNA translocase FtsK [Gemmatimonadota bacterium]
MLKEAQRRELLGLALLALAVFLTLSLVPPSALGGVGERLFPSGNLMGVVGLVLAEAGLDLLGAGALLLPIVPALAGAASFGWMPRESAVRLAWLSAGLTILLPTTLAVLDTGQSAALAAATPTAGWAGRMLRVPLVALFGWFGALFALAFLGIALSVATVGWNPARAGARAAARGAVGLRATLAQAWAGHAEARRRRAAAKAKPKSPGQVSRIDLAAVAATVTEPPKVERPKPAPAKVEKAIEEKGKAEPRKQAKAAVEHGPAGPRAVAGEHPPVELLSAAPAKDAALSEQELDRLGEIVVETLRTFKVEGRIVGRTTGPVVTQFEFVPAPGIKVNRIAALDADLALALKAPSVRIVAPIPGKGAVGVEVPNPEPEVVYLREILDAPAFQRSRGHLPIALGRDLTGRPYVADLTKMPHLLIAGTTGSGKSICINTLITSLCYRHSPRTLRFLLIDPKMVELSMYASLPHLRHPVVTDPRDAATVLKWAVLEMERRYELLSENGARSLAEFNRRLEEGQTLRRAEPVGPEGDPDRWTYTDGPLPYIVLVVDELADLILTVQADVERPLAQ